MMVQVLVVGFGSIGRRHFRHFRDLGCSPISVARTGKATMAEDPALTPDQVYFDLDVALAAGPDIVVVANPTALHVPVARKALEAGCHVLCEKPISHSLDGVAELADLARRSGRVLAVAHNQRFHPSLHKLKHWIETGEPLGQPLMARAHIGGYLPDWHPWEDYKQGYAGRTDLGGGAALTNIHEIDYLLWLLGPVVQSCGAELDLQPLGTDVDEASAFVLKHENGALSAVTLSLVQKPQTRDLHISFSGGNARLNLMTGRLQVDFHDGSSDEHLPPEGWELDHTYRDQAAAMLRAIEGAHTELTTPEQALQALHLALKRKE